MLADRGYYNGDEVLACEGTGILPVIPKTQTSGNAKRGLFTVADFIYDSALQRSDKSAATHWLFPPPARNAGLTEPLPSRRGSFFRHSFADVAPQLAVGRPEAR